MTLIYRPAIAEFLESIYRVCNRRARLDRDPLSVVMRYEATADREVAGLICSTLAFGSVELILGACSRALEPLGVRPAAALEAMDDADLRRFWADFQYRFCFPADMQALLRSIRDARRTWGSLEALFLAGEVLGETMAETAGAFVRTLRILGTPPASAVRNNGRGAAGTEGDISSGGIRPGGIRKNLLPDPADGSACKRLFLFLRWMVRKDDIDPGGWNGVSPSRLVVPLDVHMAATCRGRLGFLTAKNSGSPTLKDALNVTAQFALYSPEDPVKYDFALTRPGIDPRPGDEAFGCF